METKQPIQTAVDRRVDLLDTIAAVLPIGWYERRIDRKIHQRLLTPEGGERQLCLESRAVVRCFRIYDLSKCEDLCLGLRPALD
jgi:hypothetical protein